MKKIIEVNHYTLQINFINALSYQYIRILIVDIQDIIFRTNYYDFACSLARTLADRKLISSNEMIASFNRLLAQSESSWAKGSAVTYLYELDALDPQACRNIYLELVDQEEDMFMKQDAA